MYTLNGIKKSRKDRRSKLEVYYDILNAIRKESQYGEVKPTRIQFMSNTSYDKLITYFDELEEHFIGRFLDFSFFGMKDFAFLILLNKHFSEQ